MTCPATAKPYEDWIASGMSEGLEMAQATYQKLHGQAAPEPS